MYFVSFIEINFVIEKYTVEFFIKNGDLYHEDFKYFLNLLLEQKSSFIRLYKCIDFFRDHCAVLRLKNDCPKMTYNVDLNKNTIQIENEIYDILDYIKQ